MDNEIRRIVRQSEFVDMRHLLDTNRTTRAIAGVSYIPNITAEREGHAVDRKLVK